MKEPSNQGNKGRRRERKKGGRDEGTKGGRDEGTKEEKKKQRDRFPNFPVPFIFQLFLSDQTIDLAAQFSNPEQKALKLD